jgi:hypothetical protein
VNWQGELRAVHWMTRCLRPGRAAPDAQAALSDTHRVDSVTQYEAGIRFRLAENALGRRIEYSLLARRFRRDSAPDDSLGPVPGSIGFGAILGY